MGKLRTLIRRMVNRFGFDLHRIPKLFRPSSEDAYDLVYTNATYSPWKIDHKFMECFQLIQDFTIVDKYRCFELWQLIEQAGKLPHGDIIEVGVWRGGTGALMAHRAKMCGISCRIYLCDTFSGVVKAGQHDSTYKGGEHKNTNRKIVEDLILNRMKLDNVQILEGIFPDQTGHAVEDLKFRFGHIDVDVYQSAKDIVDWIWPRLLPGGILVFDDYGFPGCDGITKFVEEHRQDKNKVLIYNLNGHAVMIKLH